MKYISNTEFKNYIRIILITEFCLLIQMFSQKWAISLLKLHILFSKAWILILRRNKWLVGVDVWGKLILWARSTRCFRKIYDKVICEKRFPNLTSIDKFSCGVKIFSTLLTFLWPYWQKHYAGRCWRWKTRATNNSC